MRAEDAKFPRTRLQNVDAPFRNHKVPGAFIDPVIHRLANLTLLRIAGLAVGAAVVSGAAVLVTASAAGYSLPFLTPSPPAAGASTAAVAPLSALPSALR